MTTFEVKFKFREKEEVTQAQIRRVWWLLCRFYRIPMKRFYLLYFWYPV